VSCNPPGETASGEARELVGSKRPMCKADVVQNYRYWIIWRCPSVRYLDFAKVRDIEHKKAKELFGTAEEPTDLASKVPFPRSFSTLIDGVLMIQDYGCQVQRLRCPFLH
jgi:hypothetical protein